MSDQMAAPGTSSSSSPDYLALVIEWEDADEPAIPTVHAHAHAPIKSILAALGALGAVLVAGWSYHRFRQA